MKFIIKYKSTVEGTNQSTLHDGTYTLRQAQRICATHPAYTFRKVG